MTRLEQFKKLLKEKEYSLLGARLFSFFVLAERGTQEFKEVCRWYDKLAKSTKDKLNEAI